MAGPAATAAAAVDAVEVGVRLFRRSYTDLSFYTVGGADGAIEELSDYLDGANDEVGIVRLTTSTPP